MSNFDIYVVLLAFGTILGDPKFGSFHVGSPHHLAVTGYNELTLVVNCMNEFCSSSNNTVSKAFWGKKVLPEQRISYCAGIYYLIIGVYCLISSIAFSFTYLVWFKYEELKGKNRHKVQAKNGREEETSNNINKKLESMWFRIPMMIFMFLKFGTLVALEIVYASFLMTFAVNGLNWTKQDGLAVTSVFRASFAAARGLSICLAAAVSPTKMIIKDLVILISAFVVLLIWVEANNLVLWVGSGVVGFGMGSLYASSMSWADGQMIITGKAGSTFVTGTWIGALTIPASVGYLFDTVGPFSFIYSCFGDTLLLSLICLSAMLFSWFFHGIGKSNAKPKKILSTKL